MKRHYLVRKRASERETFSPLPMPFLHHSVIIHSEAIKVPFLKIVGESLCLSHSPLGLHTFI
jgi:hypothetical protein